MRKSAHERRWAALALLAAAQFVVVLDAAVVTVALPSISADLDVGTTALSWVVNAYALALGGLLLLGGRLADLAGRRRLFIIGFVVFTVASLLAGSADSERPLISARAGQGVGAALISPAALASVIAIFTDPTERARALGVWGAVYGSGGAVGVLLGGLLTDTLGWEFIFWLNVPIGLAAIALAPVLLPETRTEGSVSGLDVPGALLVTSGLSLLVFVLVRAEEVGWQSPQTVTLSGASLALLAGFVAVEAHSRAPMVPLHLFRSATLSGANIAGLLMGASLFSMFFFISLYLQQVLRMEPLEAGLSYLPIAAGISVGSVMAASVAARVGVRVTLTAGLALSAAGLAWFGHVSAGGDYVGDVLGPSLVVALGFGLALVTVVGAATTGVDPSLGGLAGGLINTVQQVGGALGLAVMVSIAAARSEAVAVPPAVALVEGFRAAFLAAAGFAAAGAVAAGVLVGRVPAPNAVPVAGR